MLRIVPCISAGALVVMILSAQAKACAADGGLGGPLTARVLRVIDGDTIAVEVRLWLDLHLTTLVRVAGIDAPELNGSCERERSLANAARTFLDKRLAGNVVRLSDIQRDKYNGRVVADVMMDDGAMLASTLLAEGLASPYGSGRSWCP